MEHDESRIPGRYVNVYCDWGASGVWNRRGAAIHPDMLPIPRELADWILGWQERFEAIPIEDIFAGKAPDEAFGREGRAIAAALAIVLPGWTVVYDRGVEPPAPQAPEVP